MEVTSVDAAIFFAVAAILSIERITYLYVWYRSKHFMKICKKAPLRYLGQTPVFVFKSLFTLFKIFQGISFLLWWYHFSKDGTVFTVLQVQGPHKYYVICAALLLIAFGQLLNFAVFYKLGNKGVFYGVRFGHKIEWVTGFPFNFISHPQYFGSVMTVFGMFLLCRFPFNDWYAVPVLEIFHYAVGAYFEA